MDIKYLKQMLDNPKIGSLSNRGMSTSEIEALEQKYNDSNQFPLAFREFLSLGGKFDNTGTVNAAFDYLEDTSKKNLANTGNNLGRPFFAIYHINDCEEFGFFYLDEKADDPQIYVCSPYGEDDGEPLVRANDVTFSELVNGGVNRRLNNLPL